MKMINYILDQTETANFDLTHPEQSVCSNPERSFTDLDNIRVLQNTQTAVEYSKIRV